MIRICIAFLFLTFPEFAMAQQSDSVVIRNVKNYKLGSTNILISPSGMKTVVRILDRSVSWPANEDIQDREAAKIVKRRDPTSDRPNADPNVSAKMFRKSYVDPKLTEEQKERIKSNKCKNFKFAGLSRAKVKTGVAEGDSYSYNSLEKFLNTLPDDDDMEWVVDALEEPWSERAIQEEKNVTLFNTYLLAYARESDNDYHLIITNKSQTIFFNVEISGLPGSSSPFYQTLKRVRQVFENYPGEVSCSGYLFMDTPTRIKKLQGSFFFDTDHKAGAVGPDGYLPETAWEIHPVTYIEFE